MKFKRLSDKDLYALCKEYGQKARFWRRRFAGLLPEVERRGLYRRRGCGSIYEFAAKLAGMSKESVDKVLQISRKLQDKPRLLEQLETGAQSWSKLEKVAYVATVQTDGEWAERLGTMSQASVEAFVQNSRLKTPLERGIQPEKHAERSGALKKEVVRFDLNPELARKFQQIAKRADFESIVSKIIQEVEKREAAEKPQSVATPSRHIPSEIDRYVRARTNDLCAFPTCTKLGTSLHHTQRWALENVHDPDRLHLLCTAHERLAHQGYIENEEQSPDHWRLRSYPAERGAKSLIDELVNVHRGG